MVVELETDYLVGGAGAMGMAFADEIIRRSRGLRIILVERRAKPGGHWNDDYRFVRLHQPAAFYGVNSEVLDTGPEDLASGARILAYYERVVEKLCATGRVTFFPQCEYQGDGRFRSMLVEDLVYQVKVRRKTVDATYSQITVPATRPPRYAVADGVSLVPINGLSRLQRPWARYVVIGAGKTGIDAVLFLLERGVEPDRVCWVVSNQAWLFNREHIFPDAVAGIVPQLLRALAEARDLEDFYLRLEEAGWLLRFDESLWPTRFRCATVTPGELAELRRVSDVVRLGRVQRIDPTEIVFDEGRLPTGPDVLHVDCTADGLVKRPPRAVFDGDHITLQPLAQCQQVFSSALTALIELRHRDDATRNAMATPVPHPEFPEEYITGGQLSVDNLLRWRWRYGWWLLRSRLSLARHLSFFTLLRLTFVGLRWERRALGNLPRLFVARDPRWRAVAGAAAPPADASEP